MNTMWTTHLRAAPVPLSASPKQPQRLLRPLAGGFSGTLNVSQLYPALSCFFLFFNRFPQRGPPMPASKKSPERIGAFSTYRFNNSKTLFGLCLGGRFLLRYRSAFLL